MHRSRVVEEISLRFYDVGESEGYMGVRSPFCPAPATAVWPCGIDAPSMEMRSNGTACRTTSSRVVIAGVCSGVRADFGLDIHALRRHGMKISEIAHRTHHDRKWAAALLVELEPLGYSGSYPTLTPQISDRGLRPACKVRAHVTERPDAIIANPRGEENQFDRVAQGFVLAKAVTVSFACGLRLNAPFDDDHVACEIWSTGGNRVPLEST